MSKHVVLRTYPDRLHAELARSFLESEDIESFVTSPSQLPGSYMIAEWGDGMIPHELKVAEEDLEAAAALLAETEVEMTDDDDDWSNPSAPAGPSGAAPGAAPPQQQTPPDAASCTYCHESLDHDDARFTQLRYLLAGAGGSFVALMIAMTFLEQLGVGMLLTMTMFFVLLMMRGYFVRHRCGKCGHYRIAGHRLTL